MTEQSARRDWLLIGVLLALVLPLRIWLICNTEVTARDSIGYIRYALQFERYPWNVVLCKNQQHPGYPALVWLTSVPVRAIDGETTPENMELSAQLVNLLASMVLIVPTYWLGRQFFDRPVSFGGTLLYHYLPTSAHHLSDGISEPIFLLLVVTGLLLGVQAIRTGAVWRCALCGMFAGLAYLTRPEGLFVIAGFGLVLIARQCRADWRTPWRQFLTGGMAALLATIAVGSIYVYATGRITNKPSAIRIFNVPGYEPVGEVTQMDGRPHAPGEELAGAHLFAAMFKLSDSRASNLQRGIWALATEINQGFLYIAGLPALLGFLWMFRSLWRDAGFWVVLTYAAIHSMSLIALSLSWGYVSDRHVMILVMGGCFFVVAFLRELPRLLLRRGVTESASWSWRDVPRSAPAWSVVLFLVLIGVCMPKATQRLHGNRAGNHEAGLWLAKHIEPWDNAVVEDDHSWSHFFSGLLFLEGREAEFPKDHPSKWYVVQTRSHNPEAEAKLRALLTPDAKVVYVWPEHVDLDHARVVIYAQRRDFTRKPWKEPRF